MSANNLGDIKNWHVSLSKFREHFQRAEREEKGSNYRPLEVDPVKLYALFKMLPPHRPMGLYTFSSSRTTNGCTGLVGLRH